MIRWLAPSILFAVALHAGTARAACPSSAVRWTSSSRTVYVTGAVSCTLTELDAFLPSDALRLVSSANKTWLLRAKLILQDGAALVVRGAAAGGDANELRLLSNDSSSGIIYIRAQWGRIDLESTKVISWDESAGGPDTRPSSNGRSFIHVRSFLASDGATARESRMNIRSSEVGWLGYNAAESYGLTWKVYGSSSGLYDKVDVLGDVTDSHIHHNYFGAYTYGAFGMNWLRNEIDHNVQYGLDPHDDSDELVISDNDVHDNGNHGIICSQRCNDLVISGNQVYRNDGNGIMIHRLVTDTVVEDNDVWDNGDAGIAVFDSSGNVIRNNHLHGNRRGIRLSVAASDNLFTGNEIEDCGDYALYFYKGSDAPTSGNGHPSRNTFQDNDIHDNPQAIKLTMADDNEFIDNRFANSGSLAFVDSEGNVLSGNTIPSGSLISTKTSSLSSADTTITRAGTSLLVQATGGGKMRFVETSTWTHRISGSSLTTTVTPTESTLTLTSSHISSSRTVQAIRLYAVIAGGSLRLTPTSWASGSGTKIWTARTSSGSVSAELRVGELTPNTDYQVLRNGSTFATRRSSGSGTISFTDTVTTTTATYTVRLP